MTQSRDVCDVISGENNKIQSLYQCQSNIDQEAGEGGEQKGQGDEGDEDDEDDEDNEDNESQEEDKGNKEDTVKYIVVDD